MDKFEYLMTIWDFAPVGKGIRLITSKGEIEKYGIKWGLTNPNMGEQEFIQISDKLGRDGWELFNVTTIDYGRGNFTSKGFFRRKISEDATG